MPAATDAVWLSVLPDMSGFGSALTKGAGSEAEKAGKESGAKFGKAALAATAAIAAGGVLATKALYNIGATFDDVSDTIRVGTGATGKALDALNQSAKNVGKQVPADFKDVGVAIADVNTRLGLTGKPLEDISAQFLELSRITGTDVASNIENVSRVFGDWGVEADKQAESLDYLFKVSQSTGIGIDQLSQKVVQYGAPMRQFGFSFEESAALMGKWAKEGVNTETVMGGLRAGLGKLSKAGKDPAKAFGEITEQIKNAGTVGEANAIAIETFGQRAGPDLAAAVREGRLDLDDLTKSLSESNETIMQAGADTMDFSEQWQLFKNEVMVGLEPLATRVFGAITSGMEWIRTTGVPAIKDMVGWMKENKTVLLIVAGAVGAVVAALLIYNGTVKVVTTLTAAWNAIQKVLNGTLKLNPIGLVVTALVLLGAALVVAYKKSETFRDIVDGAWAKIKQAISFAWEKVIKPAFKAMGDFITGTLVPVIKGLWERVVKPVFGFIGALIKTWWNVWVKPIFGLLKAYFENVLFPVFRFLWDKVVKPVMDKVGDKIKTVWSVVIKPVFNALKDFIADKVAPAFKRGVEAIGNAWDALKAAAARPVNFVIDTVYNNGIRKAFNTIAGKLGSKLALPWASPVGLKKHSNPTTSGGHQAYGGKGKLPSAAEAFGGPVDWAKGVLGKGAKWVGGKFSGMVDGLLGGLGSSPWAQMAGDVVRKIAGMAQEWLTSRVTKHAGANLGKVGRAGRVLPSGSYRIGMPYLGYPGHYGADYPAAIGTPVFSPWPGTVTATYDIPGSNPYNSTPYASYGRVVKISHPNGMSTLYAHLNSRIGSTGPVKAGQQIGTVGTNGNSSGPHLHFEVRRGGSPFNPASLGIFDSGGWLKPGMGGVNLSTKPEPVFTDAQWATLRAATRSSLLGSTHAQTKAADVGREIDRMRRELAAGLAKVERAAAVAGPDRFADSLNNAAASGARRRG